MANNRCIVGSCGRKLDSYNRCPMGHEQNHAEREYIRCAHDDCAHPAVVRVKERTGFANLCLNHYEKRHMAVVKEFCREIDATTPDKCRAIIKKLMPQIGQAKGLNHWRQIISDYESGESFPHITLKYAYDALKTEIKSESEIEVEF